jgi:hypothetical protein
MCGSEGPAPATSTWWRRWSRTTPAPFPWCGLTSPTWPKASNPEPACGFTARFAWPKAAGVCSWFPRSGRWRRTKSPCTWDGWCRYTAVWVRWVVASSGAWRPGSCSGWILGRRFWTRCFPPDTRRWPRPSPGFTSPSSPVDKTRRPACGRSWPGAPPPFTVAWRWRSLRVWPWFWKKLAPPGSESPPRFAR